MLKVLNGCEVWTNVLGERSCVLIGKDGCFVGGKKFVPSKSQTEAFWNDYCEQEGITAEIREMQKI